MKKMPRIVNPITTTPPTTPPTIAPIGVPELLRDGTEVVSIDAEDETVELLVATGCESVDSCVEDVIVKSSVVDDAVLSIRLKGVVSSSRTRVLLCVSQSHAVTVEPLVFDNRISTSPLKKSYGGCGVAIWRRKPLSLSSFRSLSFCTYRE